MSNLRETISKTMRFGIALATVNVMALLLAVSGCKTPPLQCADAGPVMPQNYNWFTTRNKVVFGTEKRTVEKPTDADSKPEKNKSPVPDDERADSSNKVTKATYTASNEPTSTSDFELTAAKILDDDSEQQKAKDSNSLTEISVARLGNESTNQENQIIDLKNSAQLEWHQFFQDSALTGLIDEALVGNQELKILAQEVRIARLEVQARSGEYRPFVNLGAGVGLEKSSRFSRNGAVEDGLEVAPGRVFPDPLPEFLGGANVSWEIDIWKRLRNLQNAAAMRYLGTQEGKNFVVTRLIAEIAEDYYELLALDNRLANLDKTIEIQQASLKIAEAKKIAGRGTELAVQRFQAEVSKNLSRKVIIAQQIIEVENRINFVLGRFPQEIQRPSVEFLDLQISTLSAGIPSQQLQNRADIRAAERRIAAAGLDVQAARARFYPSLNLHGGIGLNAFSTGFIFKTPESFVYSIAGDLVGPLINKRAIKAAYQTANAMQLQAIYDYQRTILEAHIEVVNYMTKIENYGSSIDIKKRQLAALEASVDIATKLFQNARAEYVEVLLAQREFMEAKMELIEIKQEQLGALVNAYQALGGGSTSNLCCNDLVSAPGTN